MEYFILEATKFIKPEKLVQYYDQEIREALFANKLNNIEFCGWLNEDTVDPDYSGYAERILNPRIKHDILDVLNGQTPSRAINDSDIKIMVLGRDFIEAMKGAYLMLGQTLFFSKHEEEDISTTYGSVSLNGAVYQLNIASDRIRDYYVHALTGRSFKKYVDRDNQKKEYSQFFDYALNTLNAEAFPLAEKAKSLAIDLQKRKKERNDMVHELASYYAEIEKNFFNSQQVNTLNIANAYVKNFVDKIQTNIEWYKKLVELGNLVFLIEIKTRK
jgi:hypothetical protein